MRFIDKSSLSKMYQEQEEMVKSYINFAQKKEFEGQIGYALTEYYKAFVLLKTSHNQYSMTYEDGDNTLKALFWIENKINDILKNITVEAIPNTNSDDNKITLCFKYKGNLISGHLLYDYYDHDLFETYENRQSNDGYAVVDFDTKPEKLQVFIGYHDPSSINDNRLKDAMKSLGKQSFMYSKKTIEFAKAKPEPVLTRWRN